MKNLISLVLISLLCSGCFLRVHKMDITQGNIITSENTNKLRIGMSEAEVKRIMGTPVLVNLFDDSRLLYVYTYQPPYHSMSMQHMTCVFSHGRLQSINYD